MPDVVGLGEAVEQEEGCAIAGLDAVDSDLGRYMNVKLFEASKEVRHCYKVCICCKFWMRIYDPASKSGDVKRRALHLDELRGRLPRGK